MLNEKEISENMGKAISEAFALDTKEEKKEETKEEPKENTEDNKDMKDEKKQEPEVKEQDEKKEDGIIYVEPEKYSFIPKKFIVIEDGKLNLTKTIEKVAKSYVHLESYASRKNNENERLRQMLEEIKTKYVKDEDELTEEEMSEMMENPKEFLKKYKNKVLTSKKYEQPTEDNNSEVVDRINMWVAQNGVDDETKEEMGKLYQSLNETEKIKWANLPVEDLLEFLKLKVENSKLKGLERYKPKPPIDVKTVNQTKPSKIKLDEVESLIAKEFGLTEEDLKKIK